MWFFAERSTLWTTCFRNWRNTPITWKNLSDKEPVNLRMRNRKLTCYCIECCQSRHSGRIHFVNLWTILYKYFAIRSYYIERCMVQHGVKAHQRQFSNWCMWMDSGNSFRSICSSFHSFILPDVAVNWIKNEDEADLDLPQSVL